MDIGHVLLILGGLALIGFSIWCRAGRSRGARWWRDSETSAAAVLLVLPGFGLLAVLAGLLPLAQEGSLRTVIMVLLIAVFLLVMWGGLRLPMPGWFLPEWYRTSRTRR